MGKANGNVKLVAGSVANLSTWFELVHRYSTQSNPAHSLPCFGMSR